MWSVAGAATHFTLTTYWPSYIRLLTLMRTEISVSIRIFVDVSFAFLLWILSRISFNSIHGIPYEYRECFAVPHSFQRDWHTHTRILDEQSILFIVFDLFLSLSLGSFCLFLFADSTSPLVTFRWSLHIERRKTNFAPVIWNMWATTNSNDVWCPDIQPAVQICHTQAKCDCVK